MSHQWIYGPRCGIDNCRSRKYTIADDGFKYCSRGHQAADQLIGDDDEWMGTAAKKTRRSTDEDAAKPSKYLAGREALSLFLQCYQLLLRKQVWWLVHEKDYPSELETVVRDLWALRVQMLKPLLQDRQESTQLFSSQPSSSTASRASSKSSQALSVSQSSDYEQDSGTDASLHNPSSRTTQETERPRLIDSIGIIYLATLLLRLPVSVSDVHTWLTAPGFPFLRAVDSLPVAMLQTLPPAMLRHLESRIGVPDLGKIHMATIEVAALYGKAFGMQIPRINHNLLLVRHVTTLALPLDVFSFTQHLAQLLNLTYTMPDAARLRTSLLKHPEIQLIGLLCVAVKLLYPFDGLSRPPRTLNEPAALCLPWPRWNAAHASKSSSLSSSASAMPQPSTTKTMDPQNRPGARNISNPVMASTTADMLSTTEADILNMSGPELDAYMTWFRQTWIPRNYANEDADVQEPSDFLKALWSFFPVEDESTEETTITTAPTTPHADEGHEQPGISSNGAAKDSLAFVRTVQAELKPVNPVSDADAAALDDGDILRAGSAYVHYRTVAEIPDVGRPFFIAAARAVGISLAQLVQVVFALEMKLSRWTRASKGGGQRQSRDGHSNSTQDREHSVDSLPGDEEDPMSLDLGDEDL